METGKHKDILLRSISPGLEKNERSILEKELLTDHRFSKGFREKVMSSIVSGRMFVNGKREVLKSFDKIFMRVAIPGAAAIVILAVSILLSQGSLSYDTLLGIDNNVDGVLISLLSE